VRTLVPTALALALCLVLARPARTEEQRPAPPAPAGLKELGQRLDELALRIRKLVEEANRDPAERLVDKYSGYSDDELKLRSSKRVDAEMLVDIMVDPKKNHLLREKAQQVLLRGAQVRGDPDLSQTEKQGRQSKRAYFCDRTLVKHLRDEDAVARKLTHDLLMALWRLGAAAAPAISAYNPNDEKTWKPAYNEWKKYLRKN
jgi:hypothetical protein